jgi:hypothetical protein
MINIWAKLRCLGACKQAGGQPYCLLLVASFVIYVEAASNFVVLQAGNCQAVCVGNEDAAVEVLQQLSGYQRHPLAQGGLEQF